MAKSVEVVKSIKVHGKLYQTPIHAARKWVEHALFDKHWRKWGGKSFAWGTPEYERRNKSYNRAWNKKRRKRYAQMVLPYFERLL